MYHDEVALWVAKDADLRFLKHLRVVLPSIERECSLLGQMKPRNSHHGVASHGIDKPQCCSG
jgi:hypothetical protein